MLVGDTPTPPAVGRSPSALPHSRSYASRPYELCKGLPALESLMLALRPTPQATKIGGVGRLHHLCGALLSKQATTDTTLHPSAPCALVAHLDASLRWHDGAYTAAPPRGALLSKQATTDTTLQPSAPCALVAHLDASLRWHDGAYTAAPPRGASEPSSSPSPSGRRDLTAYAGTTSTNNVAVSGAMAQGQLSLGWGIRLGWRDLRAVREPPLHQTGGRDSRFPPSRERRVFSRKRRM